MARLTLTTSRWVTALRSEKQEKFLKKLPIVVLSTMLALIAIPVLADSFTPSHSCRKPYKPYQFSSESEVDDFRTEVERYKRCINDFVDEQNEAVENHRQAGKEAIDEWNRFVNIELN